MNVTVVTSQNVPIDYETAGIGSRVAASLIDLVVIIGYMLIVTMTVIAGLHITGQWTVDLILFAPPYLYDLLCEVGFNGQTLGKKAMNIRVVKIDGSQPTIGSYLLRWLIRPIDLALMGPGVLAIITIFLSRKGQRLGDIAAGTTVVRTRGRVTLAETILTSVDDNYTPHFPTVTRLTDRDVQLITEVLAACRRERNAQMLTTLATRVRTVLGVDSGAMSPMEFIQAVLKDYTAMST